MKMPKLRLRSTYVPFMLTASWSHGLIVGGFMGVMAGAAKWDNKPQDRWAMILMAGLIGLMLLMEYLQKRRIAKVTKMVDEAKYMNELFDGGIDVGSPDFDLITTDREYRR